MGSGLERDTLNLHQLPLEAYRAVVGVGATYVASGTCYASSSPGLVL